MGSIGRWYNMDPKRVKGTPVTHTGIYQGKGLRCPMAASGGMQYVYKQIKSLSNLNTSGSALKPYPRTRHDVLQKPLQNIQTPKYRVASLLI
jgi:hypothetical protein